MTEEKDTSRHYINNAQLTEYIKEYNRKYYKCKEENKPVPIMPDTIGRAIILIAEKLGTRYNFRNYTYIDEMVADARVQAVYSVTKFDAEKYNNPFGYLTMVMFRTMGQKILTEKKQQHIIEKMMADPSLQFFEEDENGNGGNNISREDLMDFYYEGKI